MTHSVQRFHSDHSLYDDQLFWMNLHTNTRLSDLGTSWWSFGCYYTIMIPTTGLTIGSTLPLWYNYGIIVDEVTHMWINGITYDCWNITWLDGAIPTYSYFEKSSGVLLFFSNIFYDVHTAASNLIPQPPGVTVTYPNGGETLNTTITITWDAFDPNSDALTFDLDYWDGGAWVSLATGLTTPSYLWDTTTVPNGVDYRVRVTVYDGTWTAVDESDAVFAIENLILPPLPWWWWIAVLAVVIIIVIVVLVYLFMKRRGANK